MDVQGLSKALERRTSSLKHAHMAKEEAAGMRREGHQERWGESTHRVSERSIQEENKWDQARNADWHEAKGEWDDGRKGNKQMEESTRKRGPRNIERLPDYKNGGGRWNHTLVAVCGLLATLSALCVSHWICTKRSVGLIIRGDLWVKTNCGFICTWSSGISASHVCYVLIAYVTNSNRFTADSNDVPRCTVSRHRTGCNVTMWGNLTNALKWRASHIL